MNLKIFSFDQKKLSTLLFYFSFLWLVVIGKNSSALHELLTAACSLSSSTLSITASDDIPSALPPITYRFNTLSELLASDVPSGSMAGTNGYIQDFDGGAAQYIITDTCNDTLDDVFTLQLSNGNYAKLVYDKNGPVNVALFGIMPNEAISDKLNDAIKQVYGKASGLSFNNGTYYIDKPINLESLCFYGENSTLEVAYNYSTNGFSVMKTQDLASDYSIEFHDLIFTYPVCSSQTFKGGSGKDTVFLCLSNTQHFVIDSCTFISDNPNGIYNTVTFLWFKQPNHIKNVSITNSSFLNNSGTNLPASDHLIGGCLWFSGTKKALTTIENVAILNCNIYTSLSDEAVSFWFCKARNVKIADCKIANDYCINDNVIAFVDGAFNNVIVNKTSFYILTPSMYLTKMGKLWGVSNITYTNCSFNIISKNLQPYKNAISLFYIYHDNDGSKIKENSALTVTNCEFNMDGNAEGIYRCIFMASGAQNKVISFNNARFNNITLKEAYANFSKCNNCIFNSENSFNDTIKKPYSISNSTNVAINIQ